jgi:hypothetical protein
MATRILARHKPNVDGQLLSRLGDSVGYSIGFIDMNGRHLDEFCVSDRRLRNTKFLHSR